MLLSHPAVREAEIVAIEDRVKGHVPIALVTVEPGKTTGVRPLIDHCRSALEPFKVPRSIVLVESIPVMVSGKVDQSGVRRLLAAHGVGVGAGD